MLDRATDPLSPFRSLVLHFPAKISSSLPSSSLFFTSLLRPLLRIHGQQSFVTDISHWPILLFKSERREKRGERREKRDDFPNLTYGLALQHSISSPILIHLQDNPSTKNALIKCRWVLWAQLDLLSVCERGFLALEERRVRCGSAFHGSKHFFLLLVEVRSNAFTQLTHKRTGMPVPSHL